MKPMVLEAALQELAEKLEPLEWAMESLLWAVVQPQPEGQTRNALVDRYEELAHDAMGLVKEAAEAAERGLRGPSGVASLAEARQLVILCQDRILRLMGRLQEELLTFERRDALEELGQERREWAGWVQGVSDALEGCSMPVHEANQALFRCWKDLTDRVCLQAG
jgi:hypothetical protein